MPGRASNFRRIKPLMSAPPTIRGRNHRRSMLRVEASAHGRRGQQAGPTAQIMLPPMQRKAIPVGKATGITIPPYRRGVP
jgi:hypothetical protein